MMKSDNTPILVKSLFFDWLESHEYGEVGLLRMIDIWEAGFYAGKTKTIGENDERRTLRTG